VGTSRILIEVDPQSLLECPNCNYVLKGFGYETYDFQKHIVYTHHNKWTCNICERKFVMVAISSRHHLKEVL
jgi:ribosomal protein L37AE/L43A